jgi:S-adenosylmethionine:tRNA ribosyltransferase-isomerase
MAWTLDDFDYLLPDELIAQAPLDRRTDSRLLRAAQLADLHFSDLPTLLAPAICWSSTTPG